MLALTRRVGEEIVIGDPRHPLGIIRVVEIHGDKVRLSFDFPRDMQINRKELAEQKARQAGDAATSPTAATSNNHAPAPVQSAPPASATPPSNPAPATPKP